MDNYLKKLIVILAIIAIILFLGIILYNLVYKNLLY